MNIRRSSEALSEAEADALLSGRLVAEHDDLREIIGMMQATSGVPAPTPSAALAAILNEGFDPLPVASAPSASRRGRWSARIAVATAVTMTATLGAATANALPAPLQTAVANVVGAVTPLQLPRPPADAGTGSENRGGPSDEPPSVPYEQPNRDSETGADEPSGESADSTPVMTETVPAVVTPPQGPGATATSTDADEPDADEPDADVPDADVPDADEPDADEPDADVQETDEADTDEPEQPESGEIEQGDADDRDLLDSDEPELDGDA